MTINPILFNTEMVRAILDGRKNCTRRICKDANEYTVPDMDFYNADRRTYAVHNFANREHSEQLSTAERTCPICTGDILYVRETWKRRRTDTITTKIGKEMTLPMLQSGNHPSTCRKKQRGSGSRLRM